MDSGQTSTLYQRLGGVYPIAAVVDDFIDRIMKDDRLNANPATRAAHERISAPGFKFLVTEMVCWAAGGPQQYSGRSMADSHQHLHITEDEWAGFVEHLRATLDSFGVPAAEQEELLAVVAGTKDSIVTAS